MTDSTAALAHVRERYPWPDQRPDVPAVPWVMDYGGRKLITRLIADRRLRVVVEIGVFVGGSVRQWLGVSPEVTVVAIDALKCLSNTWLINTWLIDDRPWSLAERWLWLRGLPTGMRRRSVARLRACRGLDSFGNPGRA